MREARDVPERVAADRVTPIDHAGEPARIDKDVRRLQITMAERPNLNGSERGGMGVDRSGGGLSHRSGNHVTVHQTARVAADALQEAQPRAVPEREVTSLVPRSLREPAEPRQLHVVQASENDPDLRQRGMPRHDRPAVYTIHDEGAHTVVRGEAPAPQDRRSGTARVRAPRTRPCLGPQRIVHQRRLHDESTPVCVDFIHNVGSERVHAHNPSSLTAKLARHEGRDRLFAVSKSPACTHYVLIRLNIMTSDGKADPACIAGWLTETPTASCRLQACHRLGGQPCHSLARSPSKWMAIKTRSRSPTWPKNVVQTLSRRRTARAGENLACVPYR